MLKTLESHEAFTSLFERILFDHLIPLQNNIFVDSGS